MTDRKQALIYIEFHPKDSRPSRIAKPYPVDFAESDVHHVWTLYRHDDRDAPPTLPFHPVHRHNAFSEDYMHDWNIVRGEFRYASRVTDEPVWVLVEFKTDQEKAEREQRIRR